MEEDSVDKKSSPQRHIVDASTSSINGDQPSSCCVLDQLFMVSFKGLSFQEKQQIISNGRPTPNISIQTKMKDYNRNFKMDYYASSKWLTACKSRNKLYCWPCVLFHTEKEVWNTDGFCDMSNFYKAKARHEKCYSHLSAITKLQTFGRTKIDLQLNEQRRLHVLKHNAEVDSNRELMKRLIDVCCFLAKQELQFNRDHYEQETSVNLGNYIELIQLLSKYDSKLNAYLHSTGVFKETSNMIHNTIVECIGDVILDKIKSEISNAFFIAIMLDETMGVEKLSQVSTVIRYVKDGNIQERLIDFTDVSSDRTATGLSEHVFQTLTQFDCEQKLVAQSYDGSGTFSGHLSDLQSLVKKRHPSTLLIHCYTHRLNLILVQSVNQIKECKIFFKTLRGIYNFFFKSPQRGIKAEYEVMKRFPSFSNTNWNDITILVHSVNENQAQLLEFFQDVAEDPDSWDTQAFMTAKGCVPLMKNFDFAFLLKIFSHIFSITNTLFIVLQSKTLDVKNCIEKVKQTISHLRNATNNFEETFIKIEVDDNVEPPMKRCREDDQIIPNTKHARLYNEIIDTMIGQMEVRFQDLSELNFLELLDSKKFKSYQTQFPDNLLIILKSSYGSSFNFGNLRSELISVYKLSDFSNKTVTEIMHFLKETDLSEEAFPEVYKLCCLALTIPVSASSVEHSFCCLKRIQTSVRNTQNENSAHSLLSIEKGLLDELQSQTSFYNAVLEKFLQKGDTKLPLVYK